VYNLWQSRISTAKLNDWLKDVVQQHTPPLVGGRVNNVKYISQIKTRPPTFALWVSRPEDLPDSYLRYLINRLRQDFRLPFVPIRIKAKGTADKARSFGGGMGNKRQLDDKRNVAKRPWDKS
jgi:GTPase